MTAFRRVLRGAAMQFSCALRLDEWMLARVRAGGSIHAVNFHGTPSAKRESLFRQLEWVRGRFTVLDPLALDSFPAGGEPHQSCVLLTFDDGLASNFLVAAPVLESLGLRGLFFVNPGFAELNGTAAREFFIDRLAVRRDLPLSAEDWMPMLPDQIGELARRGHAIGNHTYSHVDLSRTHADRFSHEIIDSRDVLAKWTGQAIDCFAWTYRWNAITAEAWNLARLHHRFCFAPCAGLTRRGSGQADLIWRTNVECGYSESEYRFMYSGLAAIPAWPKRRRLKRELCPPAGSLETARGEHEWLPR